MELANGIAKAQVNRIKKQQINNQHCFAPFCRRSPGQHPWQIKQLIVADDFDAVAMAKNAVVGISVENPYICQIVL